MNGERGIARRLRSAAAGALAGAILLGFVPSAATAQERLPNVRVKGKTPCQIHPESALETANLWSAARETLEGTIRSDSAPPTLLVREWRRTLDYAFRLRYEDADTSIVRTRRPFEKKAPGNLERAGYIQREGWSIVYYGPDAGLLLSERFLGKHCFRRVEGEGATAGLVGLAFFPLPGAGQPDVTGVLWIDPQRNELRSVEYTWINAPEEARAPGIGGRADFVRLSSGGWMIQRWNIRMARQEAGFTRGFDGYTDRGGEVLAVLSKDRL